jgi:hypothetical protein
MSPQFSNMNELTSYLDSMEKQVKTLESQNDFLKQSLGRLEEGATNALPRTSLLSRRYMKRAFAVWGHYFVANFIIGLIISIILIGALFILGQFPNLIAYLQTLVAR